MSDIPCSPMHTTYMEELADLHLHTTCSDGALSPYELIRKAHTKGLRAISITDHDTTAALPDAVEIAREFDIDVIPGIEVSAFENGRDIHVLGYFIDYNDDALLRYAEFSRREREKRAVRIVKKLNDLNIPLALDAVMDCAGNGTVGRLHVANALISNGYSSSIKEVFDKYLGNGCPAYEEKWHFPVVDAIRLINNAGGLAVIAHPSRYISDSALRAMIADGLDGIEVIHPCHDQYLQKHYRSVATEYCLLETGGSDYHGNRDYDEANLGRIGIPYAKIKAMMYFRNNA